MRNPESPASSSGSEAVGDRRSRRGTRSPPGASRAGRAGRARRQSRAGACRPRNARRCPAGRCSPTHWRTVSRISRSSSSSKPSTSSRSCTGRARYGPRSWSPSLSSSFGAVMIRRAAGRRIGVPTEDGGMAGMKTAADLLMDARSVIQRGGSRDCVAASGAEALIVDIRSDDERHRPGLPSLPRTCSSGAFAPESGWSNRHVADTKRRLIRCAHGWSLSPAAATLVDLGYRDVGDVEGGFGGVARGRPADCLRDRTSGARPAGMALPGAATAACSRHGDGLRLTD